MVMLKLTAKAAAALGLALAAQAAPAQAALGPDAAACRSGDGPAILVNVDGFKARTGNIRVNVYGSDPAKFLERGQYIRQINLPVTRRGAMPICVSVPRAGRYAVAVRHDVDGNGRNSWNDGGGFSRNPNISLTNLRPNYGNVAFNVGGGVQNVNVVLNYRFGLSVRPVNG
ncbi:DUF2141 domain-containing protein [Sphingosinicella sp. CPCC 101087]|uniref:DUF2141 domain-containing protein n=1 Tax=Sphingosinicella sp. CPCC 101087 TaxID=2497754 RepID=UPI001FB0651F|nr:DUF2141 domain-containing protein [Sphingosinicella sp. CPCC 101087]